MKNTMPNGIPALRVKAGAMAIGADQYEGSLPLTLNKAADIRTAETGVGDAVTEVGTGHDELSNRHAAVGVAMIAAREFLMAARDSFKPDNGNEYNAGWDSTGLTSSLKIPHDKVRVLALVGSFKAYLTTHPALEVATKNITAVRAGELFTQLETAMGAVNAQKAHLKNQMRERDMKVVALRKRLRDTIKELSIKLTPLDPKWVAFGLNMPGAAQTPAVPSNVKVVLVGPTAASVNWGPSARATYYRVWMRLVGSPDWLPAGSPADLDFTIQQLASNSQIQVAVSAVNNGGESAKSEPVTITTPA